MPDILHFLAADDVWTWSDKRVIAHRIRQIRAQYRHLVQIVLVGLTKKMNNPNRVAINYIIEINCQLSLVCLFDHDNTPCWCQLNNVSGENNIHELSWSGEE